VHLPALASPWRGATKGTDAGGNSNKKDIPDEEVRQESLGLPVRDGEGVGAHDGAVEMGVSVLSVQARAFDCFLGYVGVGLGVCRLRVAGWELRREFIVMAKDFLGGVGVDQREWWRKKMC